MACMKPRIAHERQVYTYLDIFMHTRGLFTREALVYLPLHK